MKPTPGLDIPSPPAQPLMGHFAHYDFITPLLYLLRPAVRPLRNHTLRWSAGQCYLTLSPRRFVALTRSTITCGGVAWTADGQTTTIARRHDDSRRADEQLDPIHPVQRRALAAASEDVDLVTEHSVLGDQRSPGSDRVHDDAYDLARRLPRAGCDHSRPTRATTHIRIREAPASPSPTWTRKQGCQYAVLVHVDHQNAALSSNQARQIGGVQKVAVAAQGQIKTRCPTAMVWVGSSPSASATRIPD